MNVDNPLQVVTYPAKEIDFPNCKGDVHFDEVMQECITGRIYCPACNAIVHTHALLYPDEMKGASKQSLWLAWFRLHYNTSHIDNFKGTEYLNELLTNQWDFLDRYISLDDMLIYLKMYETYRPELLNQVGRTYKMKKIVK